MVKGHTLLCIKNNPREESQGLILLMTIDYIFEAESFKHSAKIFLYYKISSIRTTQL